MYNYGIQLINRRYGIDILKKTRVRMVCRPRQLYFYCISRSTIMNYREIAQSVGLVSHATVMHAIKQIKWQCEHDKYLRAEINGLMEEFDEYYKTAKDKPITKSQYEMTAIWLKGKNVNIDINETEWLQKSIYKKGIMPKTLIKLMIAFKNDKV